jgi:hypothetical protein
MHGVHSPRMVFCFGLPIEAPSNLEPDLLVECNPPGLDITTPTTTRSEKQKDMFRPE